MYIYGQIYHIYQEMLCHVLDIYRYIYWKAVSIYRHTSIYIYIYIYIHYILYIIYIYIFNLLMYMN